MEKSSISIQKKQIRERISSLLKQQTAEDRHQKSLDITQKLLGMRQFAEAKTILFYASTDEEVETFEMIKRARQLGKIIGLPRVSPSYTLTPVVINDVENDLQKGKYGIYEPKADINQAVPLEELDMVIVPAVAYDATCHRLGRGAGYYDRFLSRLPKDITTVGLAFDFQLVQKLPIDESFDIPVSLVLSN